MGNTPNCFYKNITEPSRQWLDTCPLTALLAARYHHPLITTYKKEEMNSATITTVAK